MIRSLTIVENTAEGGKVEYSAVGNLPADEAAKAIVQLAYGTRPQPAEIASDKTKEPEEK